MSKNLLKYELLNEFEEMEGAGDVVTSVVPGVAYVPEVKMVAYNDTENNENEVPLDNDGPGN